MLGRRPHCCPLEFPSTCTTKRTEPDRQGRGHSFLKKKLVFPRLQRTKICQEKTALFASFYFVPGDPSKKMPLMAQAIHLKRPFNRMMLRHNLWKKKYPDSQEVHGIPWTGIANASDEIKALHNPQMNLKGLPFDPLEYVEHLDELPFQREMDPSLGD